MERVPQEHIDDVIERYDEVLVGILDCEYFAFQYGSDQRYECPFCHKPSLQVGQRKYLNCLNPDCVFTGGNVIELYKELQGYDKNNGLQYYQSGEELYNKLDQSEPDNSMIEEEMNAFEKLPQNWRSIPSSYRGIDMVSSHESSFAFLMDIGQISSWEYEPAMIMLASGEIYRPDFFVKNVPFLIGNKIIKVDTWIEVKGNLNDDRLRKPAELSDSEFVYLFGLRPKGNNMYDIYENMIDQSLGQVCVGAPIAPFNLMGISGDKYTPSFPYITKSGTLAFGNPLIIYKEELGQNCIHEDATYYAFHTAWNMDFMHEKSHDDAIRKARIKIQQIIQGTVHIGIE